MNIIDKLISGFARLPGIGKKSAARIVYYLLKADIGFVQSLSQDIKELRSVVAKL